MSVSAEAASTMHALPVRGPESGVRLEKPSNGASVDLDIDSKTHEMGIPDDEVDNLPYPAPLARADFASPDFDPAGYLRTLRHRHQSLADLRTDLRDRTRQLTGELADLVNSNSSDFLSIGQCLTGGDERMDHVRLGLMAFRSQVVDIRADVARRRDELAGLIRQRATIGKIQQDGLRMIEFAGRIDRLEHKLVIGRQSDSGFDQDDYSSSSDEEDGDEDSERTSGRVGQTRHGVATTISRLQRHTDDFLTLCALADQIGREMPFIAAHEDRIKTVRTTLLLDLASTAREARAAASSLDPVHTLTLMDLYCRLDEVKEAISAWSSARLQ